MSEILTLTVAVKGEVISSNLPEFREAVTLFLSEVNRDLTTDEQFGQAEIDVKRLKAIEDGIAAAKVKALADAETLRTLFDNLDEANEEVRKARLELENLVKRQKESVKAALVATALNKVDCAPHLRLKNYRERIEGAIKGKRTLDSMETALNQAVGMANEQIDKCRDVIEEWKKANDEDFPPDFDALIITSPDMVRLELQRRTEKKAADAERRRLEKIAEDERAAARRAMAEAQAAAKAQAAVAAPAPALTPVVVNELPIREEQSTPIDKDVEQGESEAAERARFIALVRAAFAPIKAAREGLKHSSNIEAAKAFAAGVAVHWETLTKGRDSA